MRAAVTVTQHAREQARKRSIPERAINACVHYGSRRRNGTCEGYAIDDAAVRRARADGVDLSALRWIEVIVRDGKVVTVFRLTLAQRRGRRLREARGYEQREGSQR